MILNRALHKARFFLCKSLILNCYNRTARVAYGTVSFFATIAVASFKVEPKLLYGTSRSLNIKCVTFLGKELLLLQSDRKGCILNCKFFIFGKCNVNFIKLPYIPSLFFSVCYYNYICNIKFIGEVYV